MVLTWGKLLFAIIGLILVYLGWQDLTGGQTLYIGPFPIFTIGPGPQQIIAGIVLVVAGLAVLIVDFIWWIRRPA